MSAAQGVSVVVPVFNGRRSLPAVLAAIAQECLGRPHEIIAVDDGSSDGSSRYLQREAAAGRIRLFAGPRRGPAAAINLAIRETRYPLIAQVDQDVIVHPGWLDTLLEALEDPDVGAAQGRYTTSESAGFWARMMGRDLDQRYGRIQSRFVDHVCTGNTIYRASALHRVGLLDETFGYAADNDLSYRLIDAGYKLAFCKTATSTHLWRETPGAYLRQQYGVGYGRLDLIQKHPRRAGGDDVSGVVMIAHAGLTFAALALALLATLLAAFDFPVTPGLGLSGGLVMVLAVERLAAGVACWTRSGDRAALAFPVIHLLRDIAWAIAIAVWSGRALARRDTAPNGSMPRPDRIRPSFTTSGALPPGRGLVLIPAHNEVASIARVIRDIRRSQPSLDILVVDDASTDGTGEAIDREGARRVSLPLRGGVGGAVRAGILYAVRHGYDYAVRMDGDGQHRACDIARLLAPIATGRADAVVGSRYARARRARRQGVMKRALAAGLSLLIGRRVTDPTSGSWAFGPRAIDLLRRTHPTGYPEPELFLLLDRNRLRVEEVPIRVRPRISGRTSLTWPRTGHALARTLLALVIVPLRRAEDTGEAR
jgi:glycosyltransferase involved in cell wall biosynthesis